MDTTVRFTKVPCDFDRWQIAEAREDFENEHGTIESAIFRKKVSSLVSCICMNFHRDEFEQELDNVVAEYLFG